LVGEGVLGRVDAPGCVVGTVAGFWVVVGAVVVVVWPGTVVVGVVEAVVVVVVVPGAGGVGTGTLVPQAEEGETDTGSRKIVVEVYW
jgi:hypothetical protein